MLKLDKRADSPFWQIVGTCPYTRERIRKSTGCDREDEARKVLTAFLARRHTEAVHGPQSTTLVAEAVLEYVDKGGDARFLGPILDHLGKCRMDFTQIIAKVVLETGVCPVELLDAWSAAEDGHERIDVASYSTTHSAATDTAH